MVWGKEIARNLYGLSGDMRIQYLDISDEGHLILKVGNHEIDLYDLMTKNDLPGAHIRILPLIRKMMDQVVEAFIRAMKKHNSKLGFIPIYPLKSNSSKIVIDTIWSYGEKYNWGFNIGTIPEAELISNYSNKKPRLLVVDGVKDKAFIEKLINIKNNWEVIVDIESERDVEILKEYPEIKIGIRIKLLSTTRSPWSKSSGLYSKFGISLIDLENIINKYEYLYDRSVLLHVHAGSQIPSLEDLDKIIGETVSIYTYLREIGLNNLTYIDFGGGLAYPYTHFKKGSGFSPDYTLEEYAELIIEKTTDLEKYGTKIVFEGGRYIVAPHRITVSKVIDVRPYGVRPRIYEDIGYGIMDEIRKAESLKELNNVLRKIREAITRLTSRTKASKENRVLLEKLITSIEYEVSRKVEELLSRMKLDEFIEYIRYPSPLLEYLITPSMRVFVSFSIFNHIPDKIVVDQYFQVVPLSRLLEKPEILAILSDLTCDSMGEYGDFYSYVEKPFKEKLIPLDLLTSTDKKLLYVPNMLVKLNGIPLHIPRKGEKYYLAFLETGAYQDMLGMNHNMLSGYPEILIDIIDGQLKIKVVNKSYASKYPV